MERTGQKKHPGTDVRAYTVSIKMTKQGCHMAVEIWTRQLHCISCSREVLQEFSLEK